MRHILFPDTVGGRIRLYSILMVGIPLLIAAIALIGFVRSSILREGEQKLLEQAVSHKVFIEEWFRGNQNNVKFLANLDTVRRGQSDQIMSIFERFKETHPDISAAVYIGPDGKTLVDSSSKIVVDVSDREYFIKARAGQPHITKVIIGRTSGKPIIIFSHPVTMEDGSFGGLVFLPSQLTAINELMTNLQFGNTGETYIVNSEGYMITESRYLESLKAEGRVEKTAVMKIKLSSIVLDNGLIGAQPEKPYQDYRGVKVLGASQWAKDGSWLIVSEIDYNEAIGPL